MEHWSLRVMLHDGPGAGVPSLDIA